MSPAHQERFDRLLEDALETLPPAARRAIETIPVVVMDRPDPALIEELKRDGLIKPGETADDDPLMGLHSGVAITEASIDAPVHLPGQIHVFREAIVQFAGGWDQEHADDEVYEEVRVTLLHEIGHHFGLDEDDLEALGYG